MKNIFSKKILILALIVGVMVAYFYFDLGRFLNLEYLKTQHERFQLLYNSNKLTFVLGFSLIYIIATSLSLPGAAVMTLAGGALFGLIIGTIVVSFSSTVGATLAFLASRYLFRDMVKNKFGDRIEKINKGLEKDGKFYLFTLRLIPIFPFWLINLAMGLTPIKTLTYFWVSLVGMLPGTIVYVNAGTALSEINSIKEILSLKVIISFSLLGLFPIITKKILDFYKKRRTANGQI